MKRLILAAFCGCIVVSLVVGGCFRSRYSNRPSPSQRTVQNAPYGNSHAQAVPRELSRRGFVPLASSEIGEPLLSRRLLVENSRRDERRFRAAQVSVPVEDTVYADTTYASSSSSSVAATYTASRQTNAGARHLDAHRIARIDAPRETAPAVIEPEPVREAELLVMAEPLSLPMPRRIAQVSPDLERPEPPALPRTAPSPVSKPRKTRIRDFAPELEMPEPATVLPGDLDRKPAAEVMVSARMAERRSSLPDLDMPEVGWVDGHSLRKRQPLPPLFRTP